MCLPEKLSVKIKSANTMENAWIRFDAWFGDKNLFIKDLMQDIRSVTSIKDGDDERLMDYYVTLQAHIEEARSAGTLDMLLITANVELMVLPLTTWEKRVWSSNGNDIETKRNDISIIGVFSVSKQNEPAYSRTLKDRSKANIFMSTLCRIEVNTNWVCPKLSKIEQKRAGLVQNFPG
jgi:hypothetical protein